MRGYILEFINNVKYEEGVWVKVRSERVYT